MEIAQSDGFFAPFFTFFTFMQFPDMPHIFILKYAVIIKNANRLHMVVLYVCEDIF